MDGLNRHKKLIGERIKLLRGGRSQAVFAKQLKISLPALQRYEYGARIPRGPILERLAQMSGRSVDWILTGAESYVADRVAEESARYCSVCGEIIKMLQGLDEEARMDILKYVEKVKLIADMKRKKKKGGWLNE